MVMNLKIIGYVNTFIITISYGVKRFDEQLESTIKLFIQMFSSDFFQNVLVCFTNFSFDEKSQNKRKTGKDSNQQQIIEGMQEEFKNRFAYDLKTEQFAFIDNEV